MSRKTEEIEERAENLITPIVDAQAFEQAKQRLDAILIKIGRKAPPAEPSAFQTRMADLLHRISDRLTFIYAERCSISRYDGAISLKA